MNLLCSKKNYVKICALFLAIVISLSFFNDLLCDRVQENNLRFAVVDEIWDLNSRSFSRWNEHWHTDTWQEYIRLCVQKTLNPSLFMNRNNAFEFLLTSAKKSGAQASEQKDSRKNDVIMWQNLDLFCGSEKNTNYVAKVLDRMHTEVGRVVFFEQLACPIVDINVLQKRQNIIKTCVQDLVLREHLDLLLASMQEPEKVHIAFWNKQGIAEGFPHNLEYYHVVGKWLQEVSFLGQLNTSSHALLLKNIRDYFMKSGGTVMAAFAAGVLVSYGIAYAMNSHYASALENRASRSCGTAGFEYPWLWDFTKNSELRSAVAVTGGVFCAVNAWDRLKKMRDGVLFEQASYIFMLNVARYLSASKKLYECIKDNELLYTFDEFGGLIKFFEHDVKTDAALVELMQLIETSTMKSKAKGFEDVEILFNRGIVVRLFDLVLKEQAKLQDMMVAVGKLDMYVSCATLYKEFEHTHVHFCFPEYLVSDRPCIDVKDFWHPLIDTEKVVSNSVTLGVDGHRPNMIITGPNAGGKSCILKAVTLNLLLAQTIGIAPARSLSFTPFTLISTYLNIADDINAGSSLFRSEVLRAQGLLDKIQSFGAGKFAFTVYDEIFKGTSPVEGTAAAYGVAKLLGTFDNSICLIATHFDVLTELEQETAVFSNYKVTVNKSGTRKIGGSCIEYPFKLYVGKSDQHVALDILQNEGITGSVVEDAQNVIDKQRIALLKKVDNTSRNI